MTLRSSNRFRRVLLRPVLAFALALISWTTSTTPASSAPPPNNS